MRFLLLAALVACAEPPQPTGAETPSTQRPPNRPAAGPVADDTPAPDDASAGEAADDAPPAGEVSTDAARVRLFPDGDSPAACTTVRCLIEHRYADDARAREHALELFAVAGVVAGTEPGHTMNGGWRGTIELVPERPVGPHVRHLVWLAGAFGDIDRFFDALSAFGKPSYRFRAIELGFFRSVGRTTPSAYASGWVVAYNVSGSLHRGPDAVRETMFHEIFHLNDAAHGDWSSRALAPAFEAIVARCTKQGRLSTPCLTPHAPHHTMVRGGTYYAFQPGNGVHEYAAELAVRWFDEHRAVLAGKPRAAFKCGPEPNPTAWTLLVDEFFGGIDRTACP